jgi:ABC transporter DrrB family efflux protein
MNRFVTDTLVVARRNLLRIVRTPQLLVFSSIQPIMFVLLFRYVFGGSIQPPGYQGRYADYLLPGIMVQLTLFGGAATSVGLAEDFTKGIIDRFRSLPMSRSAVLAGRTIGDLARSLFVVLLMIGVGYLVGFRFNNGFFGAVAAIAMTLLFGFAFSWFFAYVGIAVRNTETAQVAGFLPIFPLVFAASTFTSIDTMPGPLRAFAKVNPVTNAVNAIRALSHGNTPVERFQEQLATAAASGAPPSGVGAPGAAFDPAKTLSTLQDQANAGRYVLCTVLWCIVIVAVFGSLAIRRYRKG